MDGTFEDLKIPMLVTVTETHAEVPEEEAHLAITLNRQTPIYVAEVYLAALAVMARSSPVIYRAPAPIQVQDRNRY